MKNWNRWNSHRWSTTLILAIKNLWAEKTANMHAYRVYIKYKISQNLRRLGLLNKARRIQRIHNIFDHCHYVLKLYSLNTTSIHVEVIFLEGVFKKSKQRRNFALFSWERGSLLQYLLYPRLWAPKNIGLEGVTLSIAEWPLCLMKIT